MFTVTKRVGTALKKAISEWQTSGLISSEKAQELISSHTVMSFNWGRLAKYTFWMAIFCLILSANALLFDEALVRLIKKVFNTPDIVKCVSLGVLSAALYAFGIFRRRKVSERIYSNEAILFLGVMSTAGAVFFLGKAIDTGSGHFSLLVLLSFLIYACLGFLFRSKLIWIFALLSLGSWFASETAYQSGWGAYYLGMNFPLRFVLFGFVLTAVGFVFSSYVRLQELYKITVVIGYLYLFTALWLLSIYGNYGEIGNWYQAKQFELVHWAILFGLVAIGTVVHGVKFDVDISRGFGITFLFINFYTRYFEYFWDAIHKSLFFAILGISLWIIGSKAERIWHLGQRPGTHKE